jgi:mannose-1-phosphate guanylyltransferase
MDEPLKAFILAAGLGTRLKPLTDEVPKCLLPINGKPLLGIWLDHLARQGIDEAIVNTHWHHQKVEAFLETWHSDSLRVMPAYEPRLLGSGGTILAHKQWLENGAPFFILYGDNLTNVDLKNMLAFHREHGLPFTLGVFKSAAPEQCGIAEVRSDGLVTGFVEKPREPKSNLAAAGIYVTDRRVFRFFPDLGAGWEPGSHLPLDLGLQVIPRLTGHMKAYPILEFLMDIGTPGRYEKAQAAWREVES